MVLTGMELPQAKASLVNAKGFLRTAIAQAST